MKGGGRENGEKILENGGHYSQGKEDEQKRMGRCREKDETEDERK